MQPLKKEKKGFTKSANKGKTWSAQQMKKYKTVYSGLYKPVLPIRNKMQAIYLHFNFGVATFLKVSVYQINLNNMLFH